MLEMLSGPDPGQDGPDLLGPIDTDEHVDGLAEDLLPRVAVHSLGGRVPGGDDAVERPFEDGIIGVLHDRRHPLSCLEGPLHFGDVAVNRGYADDSAVLVQDWCGGDPDWEYRSILSNAGCLKILDWLTSSQLCHGSAGLFESVIRTQQGAGLPDDLALGVAEYPLGGRIPARDDAVHADGDDGIPAELDG